MTDGVIVKSNIGFRDGGGLYLDQDTSTWLIDTLFHGNRAPEEQAVVCLFPVSQVRHALHVLLVL